MTFEASISATGRYLALLLQEPTPIPSPDVLDHALAARESTLRLLDTLERDNALGRPRHAEPGPQRARHNSGAEMVRNPTGTLNTLRGQLVRFPVRDAHALLSAQPTDRTSGLWLGLHRQATAAELQWQTADPRSRPAGPQTWALVADAAAITGAVEVLDSRVAPALLAAGRTQQAQGLEASRWSGLGVAAAHVRVVAGAGDLHEAPPLRKPGLANPVVVRDRAGQREGQRRLVELVTTMAHVDPVQLQGVLTHQARMTLAAAELVDNPDLVSVLHEHARDLTTAGVRLHQLESIEPRDPRALMQATQLARFVRAELAGARRLDMGMAVARALPSTATAIERCAERHVREGQWVIADGTDPSKPLYVQVDMGDHRPDALTYLARAAVSAEKVTGLTLPDPMPAYAADARLVPAGQSVGGVLAQARSRLYERPSAPGQRLAPPVAVERWRGLRTGIPSPDEQSR